MSASVTELVLPVTVFPDASCTDTTGWVGSAVPAVPALGCVVKASLLAAPAVIANEALVPAVSPVDVAVNVYVVALSTLQPANVATPDTAATEVDVHARFAPPEVVSARPTVFVAVVTVLPPASWTVTDGWVPHAVWLTPPPGWVVKASWLAAPTETVKVELAAVPRPVAEAVSV